ncbi:hypothetical protein RclHR1_00060015 [Rhizophagus clarus]|uniref:Uncharacterized protein n=1 Tax=Rhizophagus clarus TaxID=94130 RepID=A0A2Z6S897_9GLOM|nr:hypothetical protein RclHR1_00060015 [Rhizophagus clarus]GES74580.1 hypothetical protein GLOIN_2v1430842 [Rhizophagus clarus]
MQYQNPSRAEELCYQYIYTSRDGFGKDGKIGDVFDGECYFNLLKMRYFQDAHDVALTGSIDGYQIFHQKTEDCWIVLFFY